MAATVLKDVRFHNPRLARPGVEVMSLRDLRERSGKSLGAPERVDFLLLLFVERGVGTHSVDFESHSLRAGSVLVVRPGQVHQWRRHAGMHGTLVLASGDTLVPAALKRLAMRDWPSKFDMTPRLLALATADLSRIAADTASYTGDEMEVGLIRHEFMALLHRLAQEARPAAAKDGDSGIHRLFVRELEDNFHKRWRVLDFARRLGYSESALSRACVAATRRTAKELMDQRVALEARRVLAHGDATVVEVGHALGFSEPTNFIKFFRRTCGMTPLEFRAQARR